MVNAAILGLGVVGGGCAEILTKNAELIEKTVKDKVNIKYILDLRDMPESPFADKIIHDFNIIINDPEVSVVIEAMGGAHPAFDFSLACLNAGKSVITSNKEVVSKFGDELLRAAKNNGANYLFEASVGGGIPLLRTITDGICTSNNIYEISGILNGTTNYILTRMFKSGASFETALKEAQDKGYAERNPSADVDGIDAARKTNILAALATGKIAGEEIIHTEGITKISGDDVSNAKAAGYEIKLLGRVVNTEKGTYAYVAPHFVPLTNQIANVSDVYNAVSVIGDYVGDVMLYGQGAGAKATASAVISDVVNLLSGKEKDCTREWMRDNAYLLPFSTYECKKYVCLKSGSHLQKLAEKFEDCMIISSRALIIPSMSEEATETILSEFDIENIIRVL